MFGLMFIRFIQTIFIKLGRPSTNAPIIDTGFGNGAILGLIKIFDNKLHTPFALISSVLKVAF